MDAEISDIVMQLEKESTIFKNKNLLDVSLFPTKIISRERQIKELVRYVAQYKNNFVVPFITMFGRSGSGKSVIARYICEEFSCDVSSAFVNLRQSKTVFGAANVILSELGLPSSKSAQGMHQAIETIENAIESILKKESRNCFVLVLDELDFLFYDTRGNPSNFLYRLVTIGENLRKKGLLFCIIGILNNGLAEYDLDDRVRSRIGSAEIFFEPYSENRIFDILKERSDGAFAVAIDLSVLEYIAEISSIEYGDARRAIDLLRVAAEIAGAAGEPLSKKHVDIAHEKLAIDRIKSTVEYASYHFRVLCLAIAKLAFVSGKEWHKTSEISDVYKKFVKNYKPLGERRIAEILTDIKNSGLVISKTASSGRGGYGTSYKLTATPETMGEGLGNDWWGPVVAAELERQKLELLLSKTERHKRLKQNPFVAMQQLGEKLDHMEEKLEKYRAMGRTDSVNYNVENVEPE